MIIHQTKCKRTQIISSYRKLEHTQKPRLIAIIQKNSIFIHTAIVNVIKSLFIPCSALSGHSKPSFSILDDLTPQFRSLKEKKDKKGVRALEALCPPMLDPRCTRALRALSTQSSLGSS